MWFGGVFLSFFKGQLRRNSQSVLNGKIPAPTPALGNTMAAWQYHDNIAQRVQARIDIMWLVVYLNTPLEGIVANLTDVVN